MSIKDSSELLSTLLSQTDKKYEQKVYNCFIRKLSSLKKRDLTENQSQLIQEKLSSLNLKSTTENKKIYYKQKHSEFTDFLKNEFSFTSARHYTETWMVYGMIFGAGMGLSIGTALGTVFGGGSGTAIETAIGLSTGTGIGMVFGMMFGARKDAEAKEKNLVLGL